MNMNMNMEILQFVAFHPQHPVIYLRSFEVMHVMMPLTIQEVFNMPDVPILDVVNNSRKVVQQYFNSLPQNPYGLTFHSTFQEGVVQTISGLRGSQNFIWIKIISSLPQLPRLE